MKLFPLLLTALLGLFLVQASAQAGHRRSSGGLVGWSAGSMPPLQGWGRGNYYGAGGLQYGHPSNRIYGSTPPLNGWVIYTDAWGRQTYQWGYRGCR